LEQDLLYMGDPKEWLLVDKYIKDPFIHNWDIEDLKEIPDDYLTEIYCSHALEHLSHRKVIEILKLWARKMTHNGLILINVPDLLYALKQLRNLENDQIPDGLYHDFFGLHSPLSIIYGTHSQPGEYHMGGFTANLLKYAMEQAGFVNVTTDVLPDAHQMDVIIGRGRKE
jgi:predicted SAM-dependent methyltransferase